MPKEEEQLLLQFKQRIAQLMGLCSMLKEQNQKLEEELRDCKKELEESDLKAEDFQRRYLNLKAMRSFNTSDVEKDTALQKRIGKLAKEVEKCIKLLSV